jgi:intracellular septation protein A
VQLSNVLSGKIVTKEPREYLASRQARALLTAVPLFILFVALFAVVQFATPGLAGNDGYYHIKMGYLIRQEGLTPVFDALPHTILNAEAFYDHHLLYHVYLALFANIDPAVDGGLQLTQGAKLATVVLPALSFLAIWWLLRSQSVPWAALWTVALFAVSEAFLYRMSMPRAQSGSLLLLVLGLLWLLNGRYWRLLPLGFVYVWFYNAFPLLLVVAGVYLFATWMLTRRLAWQALFYPAVGIGLGLLINPYFPQNVTFIASHLLPKAGESATQVGNEWTPYRTWTLVENSGLALAAVLLGALAMGWREKRIERNTLVAFGLVLIFGFMLFKSRRFVEYFPPFALIFLALSVSPLLASWLAHWRRRELVRERPFLTHLLPMAAALLLPFSLFVSIRDARDLMDNSKAAGRYADAALWLQSNSTSGAKIFQTDWDDFTRLFFYNSAAIYTAGLDPTFMQLEDPELFDEWVAITRGKVENPSVAIRSRFAAHYVFSDTKHKAFLERAAGDPGLVELYRSEDAVVFAVKE